MPYLIHYAWRCWTAIHGGCYRGEPKKFSFSPVKKQILPKPGSFLGEPENSQGDESLLTLQKLQRTHKNHSFLIWCHRPSSPPLTAPVHWEQIETSLFWNTVSFIQRNPKSEWSSATITNRETGVSVSGGKVLAGIGRIAKLKVGQAH